MCHLVYCSVTDGGVAAAKRANEVVCKGDRELHLKLQKKETLIMQRLQRLTSETSEERGEHLHQMTQCC